MVKACSRLRTSHFRCGGGESRSSAKIHRRKKRVGSTPTSGTNYWSRGLLKERPKLNPDRALQAYVIGVALGDGNLSNPNGRAARLRITCDSKYPDVIVSVSRALQLLLPDNRVTIVGSKGNYVNVSVYSNHLESLLGWLADGGSKHQQRVEVPKWVRESPRFVVPCLRGLIDTDGAVYQDRGYPMVIFSTIIDRLADDVFGMIRDLGFRPRVYCVPNGVRLKYQIRLSRDVADFLRLVQPCKAIGLQLDSPLPATASALPISPGPRPSPAATASARLPRRRSAGRARQTAWR